MDKIKKIALSGLFISLGIVLPFVTAYIPSVGNALLPMHIPVLLCGILCGKRYGFIVGLVLPILRYILFGMPPLFPVGIAMTFELATYGFVIGFCYEKLPKKDFFVYISLVVAMLIGRVVWGIIMTILSFTSDIQFSFSMFINMAFMFSIFGIALQIIIIPPIVIGLRKAGYFNKK